MTSPGIWNSLPVRDIYRTFICYLLCPNLIECQATIFQSDLNVVHREKLANKFIRGHVTPVRKIGVLVAADAGSRHWHKRLFRCATATDVNHDADDGLLVSVVLKLANAANLKIGKNERSLDILLLGDSYFRHKN